MKDDPELQEIFTDPAHVEVVDLLRSARPKTPPLDPNFRSYLRAKLMAEAQKTLPARASRSWFSFSFAPRTLAPAMAAVAAGFLVVLGIEVYLHNQVSPAVASIVHVNVKDINNKTDVATAEPIQIPFSGPVDKNAVAESVVIEPATSATKQWVGNTLVIIPDHPLAPNTNYTVSFKPQAVAPTPAPTPTTASTAPTAPKATPTPTPTPAPAPAPTPVVVHFTTARAPIPPVVPPSFKSSNVTYGHDNRLADAGTILNATWTASGQILATRPSGQPGPTATPTSSPSPSTKPTSDVWLMSPGGVPLRQLVVGATMPSAPATGSLFAAWTVNGAQATLDVRDLQGTLITSVATIDGAPSRAAVWLGTDRLAYVDNGVLRVVDLRGTAIALPRTLHVDQGSIAASPSGALLAVETVDGSVIIDLGASSVTRLHDGATGFNWSPVGDLAFVIQKDAGTDLYIAADGKNASKVVTSPGSQLWSNLNWAPDATSLLLATRPTGSISGTTGLLLVNRDGSNPTSFGAPQSEYASPRWSPGGDLVLFTRHDEATGKTAFWTATASTTGANAAEQQALAEVQTFIQARMQGDTQAAQAELDDNARAAYSAGNSLLVSASGTKFNRYYPVTVQLTSTTPNQFLIGVRIFIAKSGGRETSFFEEQLTLVQQGQRYVIDSVKATPVTQLGHGPTVLSFQVVPAPPGEQVLVQFDADLNPDTVNADTIQVRTADGQVVDGKVSFDADQHLVKIAVKLKEGTYQLVVTTGVTDINNTPLAQEYDAPLVISHSAG